MWLNYKDYKHQHALLDVLKIAQDEVAEFMAHRNYKEMADITWFEEQYGHKLPHQDIMKKWWTVPSVRAGQLTKWASVLPKMSAAAIQLPGIVNFSLNAIEAGGAVPVHSDYSFDMREDLSKTKKAYTIVMGVSIPSTDINICGFVLGDKRIVLHTGEIIAFDGHTPHGSWNNSNAWRYTINMDIATEYWNYADIS